MRKKRQDLKRTQDSGHFFPKTVVLVNSNTDKCKWCTVGPAQVRTRSSIWSSPIRTTGQDFLHSCRHFFGLHLSLLTMAILVNLSCDMLLLKIKTNQNQNESNTEINKLPISPQNASKRHNLTCRWSYMSEGKPPGFPVIR